MGKAEQQFEHLTDAQIEHYGDRTSGEGPNQNGLEIDQAIETHLADCAGCRIRVLEFHRSRFGLMSDPSSSAPNHSGPNSQGAPDSSRKNDTGSSLSPSNLDLLFLGRSDEDRPTPDCPTADALRDLAAGLSSADVPQLTQHAAQCPHCGPILRAYTEDFSDDLSPEDEALLSQLKSSTPAWQKQMAQQMANAVSATPRISVSEEAGVAQPPSAVLESPSTKEARVAQQGSPDSPVLAGRGGQPPSAVHGSPSTNEARVARPGGQSPSAVRFQLPSLRWILAPVALAATPVIAFFIWSAQRETPEKVEKLLAQAYTEQRTLEFRWPGAAWADYKEARSRQPESLLSSPEPLRKAADLIARHVQKSPEDPAWLLMKARLELQEWNYQLALETLNEVDDPKLADSPEFLLTRALALYERAEYSNSETEQPSYLDAIDLLGKALQKTPQDPDLLFNQALICQKARAYECAITDYERFLGIEKNTAWSEEAQRNLRQIHEKKTLAP